MATPPPPSDDHAAPHWAERLSRSRLGLGVLSFLESTVVPVPLETLIAPLMVSYTRRAIAIATVVLIGCLIGAGSFYWVGRLALDPVVLPALQRLGLEAEFRALQERLSSDRNTFIAVMLVSLSPAPMQLATLGAGTARADFALFMAAILVSRATRYYGLALLCRLLGERITHLGIRRRTMVLIGAVVLFGGWLIYRLVF